MQDIGLEAAQPQIIKQIRPLDAEKIELREALGRVSAEDSYADSDLPAHHQSAVDGYAVAEEGPMEAGKYLITGHLNLGDIANEPLEAGQTIGVETGGNLPPGVRAV